MAGDVLVRGGEVVDGTGSPPRAADVRVREGRIVEVGPDLAADGERVVDATGAYVTPGLIESHTHYDAALWWDPDADPMPAHGCTTLVMGNCGLGLAPLRPADETDLVDLFAFIEDIPAEAFHLAVPWKWETWPEYRAAAGAHPTAVNSVAFLPHQMLRTWVMGPAAWERAATPDERRELARMLDEGLAAGALGLSTSMMDVDRANRLVPSRLADDTEFADLLAVLARHDAVLQYVPRFLQPEYFLPDLERVATAARAAGVRTLFAGYELNETGADQRHRLERFLAEQWAAGTPLWANFSARPTHVNMHFERSIMWSGVASWHDLVQAPLDEKRRMLADDAWRARARAEWDACTYTLAPVRSPERLKLLGGPRSGELLSDAVARTGQHPSDVLADWLASTDLEGNLRTVDRVIDQEAATALVRNPRGISGASDAGAHVQMFSGAGDSTFLLAHLVRDTEAVRIEEAVHAVTGQQAAFFGIPDRGVIRPGAVGDLAVFALGELDEGTEVATRDLPGGAWRYSRTPGGYRATVVAGVATWMDGEATGQRPGSLISRA